MPSLQILRSFAVQQGATRKKRRVILAAIVMLREAQEMLPMQLHDIGGFSTRGRQSEFRWDRGDFAFRVALSLQLSETE